MGYTNGDALVQIYTTTTENEIARAAWIWARATAKRDAKVVGHTADRDSLEVLNQILQRSERAFLLVLTEEQRDDADPAEDTQGEGTDDILAFAAIEPVGAGDSAAAELRYLGVAPGRWGEGWARRLLVAIPKYLRERDFNHISLWVHAENIRAIFVYEAMGWTATGQNRVRQSTGWIEGEYRLSLS